MSAGIDRPRPAYGEYATPEQVARARGMSLEEYERHLESLTTPRTPEPTTDAAAPPSATAPGRSASPPAARFPRNRFATMALLAFGLACILLSIPGFLQLGDGMQAAFADRGLEAYTSFALARTLGFLAIVIQVLIWVVAVAASVTAMRRGRTSWWIPLVAGVIAVIVVSILAIAAIVADPAFSAFVTSAGR